LAPIPLFSCKCEKLEGGRLKKGGKWEMGNGSIALTAQVST